MTIKAISLLASALLILFCVTTTHAASPPQEYSVLSLTEVLAEVGYNYDEDYETDHDKAATNHRMMHALGEALESLDEDGWSLVIIHQKMFIFQRIAGP
jgi:hypothetical protein